MVIPNLPQMCRQPHDSLCISLGLRAVENSNFIMKNNHPQHLVSVREVAVVTGVCGYTLQQFTLEF
jgi:predicted TIM-barrel enzyme